MPGIQRRKVERDATTTQLAAQFEPPIAALNNPIAAPLAQAPQRLWWGRRVATYINSWSLQQKILVVAFSVGLIAIVAGLVAQMKDPPKIVRFDVEECLRTHRGMPDCYNQLEFYSNIANIHKAFARKQT